MLEKDKQAMPVPVIERRHVEALAADEQVNPVTIECLNRLSDALFVMARYENFKQGEPDVLWDSRA